MLLKVNESVEYIRRKVLKEYDRHTLVFESEMENGSLFLVYNLHIRQANLGVSIVIEENNDFRLIHYAYTENRVGFLQRRTYEGKNEENRFLRRLTDMGIKYEFFE